jgi:hypothetical protein
VGFQFMRANARTNARECRALVRDHLERHRGRELSR